jgi:hypothetical protein
MVPEEDSSLSSLLTSQSRLLENWVQLFLLPRISAAKGHMDKKVKKVKGGDTFIHSWLV